jgi:hypothetical protein
MWLSYRGSFLIDVGDMHSEFTTFRSRNSQQSKSSSQGRMMIILANLTNGKCKLPDYYDIPAFGRAAEECLGAPSG